MRGFMHWIIPVDKFDLEMALTALSHRIGRDALLRLPTATAAKHQLRRRTSVYALGIWSPAIAGVEAAINTSHQRRVGCMIRRYSKGSAPFCLRAKLRHA